MYIYNRSKLAAKINEVVWALSENQMLSIQILAFSIFWLSTVHTVKCQKRDIRKREIAEIRTLLAVGFWTAVTQPCHWARQFWAFRAIHFLSKMVKVSILDSVWEWDKSPTLENEIRSISDIHCMYLFWLFSDDVEVIDVSSRMRLSGRMAIRAFLHPRATVGEAVEAVKEDLVNFYFYRYVQKSDLSKI